MITGKPGVKEEQRTGELDRHIALSGYIMEGVTEDEAEQKGRGRLIIRINHNITAKYLAGNILNIVLFLRLFEDFGSLLPNRIDMDRYNFRE